CSACPRIGSPSPATATSVPWFRTRPPTGDSSTGASISLSFAVPLGGSTNEEEADYRGPRPAARGRGRRLQARARTEAEAGAAGEGAGRACPAGERVRRQPGRRPLREGVGRAADDEGTPGARGGDAADA